MNRVLPKSGSCRVCGCDDFNPCAEGCSWVKVEKGSVYAAPLRLCSACSGTVGDMKEAIERGTKVLLNFSGAAAATYAVLIGSAALRRQSVRVRNEARTIDASWGDR